MPGPTEEQLVKMVDGYAAELEERVHAGHVAALGVFIQHTVDTCNFQSKGPELLRAIDRADAAVREADHVTQHWYDTVAHAREKLAGEDDDQTD